MTKTTKLELGFLKYPQGISVTQAGLGPNASDCIRTYPNRSEQVRIRPIRTKHARKLEKTSESFEKIVKNFKTKLGASKNSFNNKNRHFEQSSKKKWALQKKFQKQIGGFKNSLTKTGASKTNNNKKNIAQINHAVALGNDKP